MSEIDRASQSTDERVADAVTHSSTYGVAEYLAAGPSLMQSWLGAKRVGGNPRGAALVQVCVDLARAGFGAAVDIEVLKELHDRYPIHSTLRAEEWSDAVAWATTVRHGVSGLLTPGEYEGTWRAFDYLPDSISRDKGDRQDIPDFIREEALKLCPDEDDQWLIGMRAYMAGATEHAIAAWAPLAENGNGSAASNLVSIAQEAGDRKAEQYWRYLESQDPFYSREIPIDISKPLYEPESGKVRIGESRTGELSEIPLHRPGVGVCHGLITGAPGVGKSNSLNVILVGAFTSAKYLLWLIDWSIDQKHFKALHNAADWISGNDPERSSQILNAAVNVLEKRRELGGFKDPKPDKPAIIIGIEDAHHLFKSHPESRHLCLHILKYGAEAGVSIFMTLPDLNLERFGGNEQLRREAASADHIQMFMGSHSLPMVREAERVRRTNPSSDPFD
ncbi:hypothetical protein GTW69_06860 [Streptomyces sp. SID7760]|nr:hypothetical protein [Streptomyces sp. SID7760]